MKPASEKMREKITNTKFKKPLFKIVNNVTAKPEDDENIIKKLLIDQIFSTVKWRDSIIYMSSEGVTNYIEIGPGKVLSGMVKRTIKNVKSFSINSITDIESQKMNLQNKKVLITGSTGGIGNFSCSKIY